MKKLTAAIGALSIALLSGCVKELRPDNSFPNEKEPQEIGNSLSTWGDNDKFVPGEIIIRFKKGASQTGRANALARIGGKVKEHIVTGAMRHFSDYEGVHLVNIPINALEAIQRVKGLPEVEYAEPNWIYTSPLPTSHPSPTDPYYTGKEGQLWGAGSTEPSNYGSNADAAWREHFTGSKAVYVGVIDEGIQLDHPDLQGQIWTNPFDPKDKKDNDGNGYVDDINGWDFAGNNNTIYDGGKLGNADDHGTHVAGTIGAKQNGKGVIGINWEITIISGKFLGVNGGTTANAIKAVDYFTDLKKRHRLNIVATNNSWGGGGFSQALLDAIARGAKANILFIAAAGNGGSDGVGDNNDVTPNYPSNYNTENQAGGTTSSINDATTVCTYDAVIAVGAHRSEVLKEGEARKATFSNFGATTVDLFAPGQTIASTTAYNTYSYYSGTSMATPHVTGAVALFAAYNSGASAAEIKSNIMTSVRPTLGLQNICVSGGRLDILSALKKMNNATIEAD